MKLIPILFQPDMVRAILDDRKTQTRRVITERNSSSSAKLWELNFDDSIIDGVKSVNQYLKVAGDTADLIGTRHRVFCKYEPGDVLWVRETFFPAYKYASSPVFTGYKYVFKADDAFIGEHKWKPSIHMPFDACRLFLKVKSVRVEILQSITTPDAIAEGIEPLNMSTMQLMQQGQLYRDYLSTDQPFQDGLGAIDSYKALWVSINGIDSLGSNPWVWVIEFERTEKPAVHHQSSNS